MEKQRKDNERSHGKRIVRHAEVTWGWSTAAGRLRVKRRMRQARPFLGDRLVNLLEFGCGTGVFTRELLKASKRVFSFDISFDLAKVAREKTPGGRILVADAERLPFSDNAFDLVFGVSVLHHLQLGISLREIKRVLKEGGGLLFFEPNMANPQIFLQKNIPWLKQRMGDTPHETAFFRWEMKQQLIDLGFNGVNIYPFEFLHPRLPAFLIKAVTRIEPVLEASPLVREIAGSLLIKAQKNHG